MFNLIMGFIDFADGTTSIPASRMFNYTDQRLAAAFQGNGGPDFDQLIRLPSLLMNEGRGGEICRVGQVTRARIAGRELHFDFELDPAAPALTNGLIWANRHRLGAIEDGQFDRSHWAVKDADLYKFLLHRANLRRQRPVVFEIPEHEDIELDLVSAMMPFDAGMDPVYDSIQAAARNVGLRCRRADDFWRHAAIIQDVVTLIDRSRMVICDCTGRNANVFYEAGIAHTLGREVILITQNGEDIPFDLRHLRHIRYLNNNEGRAKLVTELEARLRTIMGG